MKLGHVHIKVTDLKRSKAYYTDVIGMRLVEELAGQFAFLSFGSAHHDLALQQSNRKSEPANESVLYHIAFEVQSIESLEQVTSRLEANGYPVSSVDHGISWAAYTKDPDGNGVEIYMDRRESEGGIRFWNGSSRPLKLTRGQQ